MAEVKSIETTTASGVTKLQRHPKRITITVNWALHQRLQNASDHEGRSLSNLAAYLLEAGCPAT